MAEINYDKMHKLDLFVKIVIAVLSIAGLAISVILLFTGMTIVPVNQMVDVFIYVLVIFYFVFGYKKAHSNILKYIFIFFAVAISYNALTYQSISRIQTYSLILIALMLAYLSGRLNRFHKNRWLLLFGFLLLIVSCIYSVVTFPTEILNGYGGLEVDVYKWSYFNVIIQYAALSISYLSRCYIHLRAGNLADIQNEI